MPTWREKVQRKLADACVPRFKMHFDLRDNNVNVHDTGFLDAAKVICEKRGCKTIVTETVPGSNFSRVLLHDEPRDLEVIPVPVSSKRKRKPKKGAGAKKENKVYKCWVLE
mmetsp:Transcript_29937/g.75427  ORF Transcript_29937/g.75427 Transcript_29937/m.75427 type:complete len:111 (+) Transcript_29937:121-453(+)|eukprot:CAMPEP_0115700958 /NCGR_PEP_ID=MMETSP0272-20121206/67696_1 /TAXON_ID=71861 /ORGANISM="Scrippsiella trochoidea, Strain CCMP3099" /LENGTH=110 /DNA_ID=CAMNT_0003141497 /DNA_START=118 /DNA_END=450 /DNA_ORIENTATION=-